MVAWVVNLTLLFFLSLQMAFRSQLKSTNVFIAGKKYFCNETPQESRHCITAFGVVLCCQGHKLFSVLEDKKPQEPPKICMLDDASKIIFIWSFIKVNYLSEGCGLACTDPGIASLVLPQKPSKPATAQKGKYFTPCFTHREWKQRNSE